MATASAGATKTVNKMKTINSCRRRGICCMDMKGRSLASTVSPMKDDRRILIISKDELVIRSAYSDYRRDWSAGVRRQIQRDERDDALRDDDAALKHGCAAQLFRKLPQRDGCLVADVRSVYGTNTRSTNLGFAQIGLLVSDP